MTNEHNKIDLDEPVAMFHWNDDADSFDRSVAVFTLRRFLHFCRHFVDVDVVIFDVFCRLCRDETKCTAEINLNKTHFMLTLPKKLEHFIAVVLNA